MLLDSMILLNFINFVIGSQAVMSSFPAAAGAASSKSGKPTRELCFLCDLPRMPWSMVQDFSGMTRVQ